MPRSDAWPSFAAAARAYGLSPRQLRKRLKKGSMQARTLPDSEGGVAWIVEPAVACQEPPAVGWQSLLDEREARINELKAQLDNLQDNLREAQRANSEMRVLVAQCLRALPGGATNLPPEITVATAERTSGESAEIAAPVLKGNAAEVTRETNPSVANAKRNPASVHARPVARITHRRRPARPLWAAWLGYRP